MACPGNGHACASPPPSAAPEAGLRWRARAALRNEGSGPPVDKNLPPFIYLGCDDPPPRTRKCRYWNSASPSVLNISLLKSRLNKLLLNSHLCFRVKHRLGVSNTVGPSGGWGRKANRTKCSEFHCRVMVGTLILDFMTRVASRTYGVGSTKMQATQIHTSPKRLRQIPSRNMNKLLSAALKSRAPFLFPP